MEERKVASLHSISLRGFKSFKNKAKVGPLTNFSCIVGPNGAGKSVVGEALAFALGGMTRTMRAKNAAALVNDHLKRQTNPSAKVSVTMRLTDGKMLKLSRLLTGTKSRYFMKENGTRRELTLTALKDELAAIGIDVNACDRFLVMQNQQVVKARQPLELSKYLEWLTGAGHFEEQINEVDEKISKFTAQLGALQDRLAEVQSRRSALAPVVESWQRFYKEWQEFIQRKVSFLRKQEKALKSQLTTYLREEEQLATEKQATEQTITEAGATSNQLRLRQKELQHTTIEISKVTAAAAKRKELFRGQVIKAKVRFDEALKESKRQKKLKKSEAADLLKQKHLIEEELNLAANELAELEAATVDKSEQYKANSGQELLLKAETERDLLLSKISRVEELLKDAVTQKEKCERKVSELTIETQNLQEEMSRATSDADQHEQAKTDLRRQMENLVQHVQSISLSLTRSKVELAAVEKRAKKIADSSGVPSRKSREDEAASFLKLKLQERLLGRLADIATVEDGMVIAANAVLCHLMNIATTFVTEDRRAANEIISHFQSHRIGVATCEILVESSQAAAKHPSDRRSLLGYIHCQEKVRRIFTKYLADWIVLPDRDAAISYCKHHTSGICNVVTLCGDIFKKDGEVIRAPIFKSKINMLRGRDRDFSAEPMDIDEPSLYDLVQRRSALQATVIEEEQKLSSLREELKAVQEQLSSNTGTLAAWNVLQTRLQNKLDELKSVKLRLPSLTVDKRLSTELRKLLMRKQQSEKRLSDLRAAFPSSAGCSIQAKVKRKKSRIKQLRKQLQDLTFQLSYDRMDEEIDMKSLENALHDGKTQLEEAALESARRSEELEKMKRDVSSVEESIHAQDALAAKAKKKRAVLSSKLEQLLASRLHVQSSVEKVLNALSETAEDHAFKRACLDQNTADQSAVDDEGQVLAQEEKLLLEERRTIDAQALEEDVACRKKELSLVDELKVTAEQLKAEGLLKEELESKRFLAFREAMVKVNECLSKIYKGLTRHGDAYLTYTEDKSLFFADGVHFHVRPDRHKWRNFRSLSGGQQALAGLALSFSLQLAYPSPFYFFDEIDASFDTKNARIVAEYLQGMASAQYILVSHRPQLYELASTLVGVYHFESSSACITVTPDSSSTCQEQQATQEVENQPDQDTQIHETTSSGIWNFE